MARFFISGREECRCQCADQLHGSQVPRQGEHSARRSQSGAGNVLHPSAVLPTLPNSHSFRLLLLGHRVETCMQVMPPLGALELGYKRCAATQSYLFLLYHSLFLSLLLRLFMSSLTNLNFYILITFLLFFLQLWGSEYRVGGLSVGLNIRSVIGVSLSLSYII